MTQESTAPADTEPAAADPVAADPAAGQSSSRLVASVHEALRRQDATLAVAESLTGGLLGAALTDVAGSSATFRGGVVAYATDLKADLLGVDGALLAAHGAVHAGVALAMARGVRDLLGSTYGVATTGVAGPESADGQPPGTVFVAVVGTADGVERVAALELAGGRHDVRAATVRSALRLLAAVLAGSPAREAGS